jgi:hypothetical protein
MYKLTDTTTIIRLEDSASIPADPANTDYANYLEWSAEGNEPLPADPPREPTEEELRNEAMLTGAEYNGYQVSFTADDGNGMLQVKAAFEMGLTGTVIHFDNGTKMPIVAADFPAFAAWFVVERNKFFVGEP